MKALPGASSRAASARLSVVNALGRAAVNAFHPRMLALVAWPLVIALVLWLGLAWFFGAQALSGVQSWFSASDWFIRWTAWAQSPAWSYFAAGVGWLLGFFLLIPLILITASIIIGTVSMPLIVKFVGERNYPALTMRKGGSVAGSVGNALLALMVLVALAVVSLPLWLLPPLWPLLPIALFAYFNQRLFRYDALADHASADEIKALVKSERGSLWMLGIALAFIGHIPLLGLMMPVLGGLAFTHFLLDRLARSRANNPISRNDSLY